MTGNGWWIVKSWWYWWPTWSTTEHWGNQCSFHCKCMRFSYVTKFIVLTKFIVFASIASISVGTLISLQKCGNMKSHNATGMDKYLTLVIWMQNMLSVRAFGSCIYNLRDDLLELWTIKLISLSFLRTSQVLSQLPRSISLSLCYFSANLISSGCYTILVILSISNVSLLLFYSDSGMNWGPISISLVHPRKCMILKW